MQAEGIGEVIESRRAGETVLVTTAAGAANATCS